MKEDEIARELLSNGEMRKIYISVRRARLGTFRTRKNKKTW
jgi:hypothetical protein